MKKLVLSIIVLLALLAIPTLVFAHQEDISTTTFYACESNTGTGEIDANSITQNDALVCNAGIFTNTVQWSVTGPAGPQGDPGVKGDKGDTGSQGPLGPTGTNGSSVLTSAGAPTGTCTSGDTDVDLANGEVYSCVGSAWVDSTHTIKGDTGPTGPASTVPGPKGDTGPQGLPGTSGLPFSAAICTTDGFTGAAEQEDLVFCISGIAPDDGLLHEAAINAANHHVLVGTPIFSTQSVDWGGAPIIYVGFTSGLHAEYHANNIVRFYNAANQQVF